MPDAERLAETRPPHIEWIPIQPTPMVDRTNEVGLIQRMLTVDGVRLLTLLGPAGVGKTRLALAAAIRLADHFRDGVVVVDLSTIRDHQSVLPTIAQALGLTDTGKPPLAERLRDFLRERSLLLTLDNLEQVLPAAAAPVANLVASCPELTVLVTSRPPLWSAGSRRFASLRFRRLTSAAQCLPWSSCRISRRSPSSCSAPAPAARTLC